MVMILMDLAVNGRLSFLVALLDYCLVHNGWSNLFVHGGIMVTRLVPNRRR
jgi:hypothetical protein